MDAGTKQGRPAPTAPEQHQAGTRRAVPAKEPGEQKREKPFSAQWLDFLEADQQQDTTTGKPLIQSNELHVARALAAYVKYDDPQQPVWPSVATVVRKTRLSESSVKRALKSLAAACYLNIVRQKSAEGDPDTNRYFLKFPSAVSTSVPCEPTPPFPVNPPPPHSEPTPGFPVNPKQESGKQELKEKNNNSAPPSESATTAEHVVVLLREQGVEATQARRLADTFSAQEIVQQIEWLPYREVKTSKQGMLMRAIERRMTAPATFPRPASGRRAASPPSPGRQSADRASRPTQAQTEPAQITPPLVAAPATSDAAEAPSASRHELTPEVQEASKQGFQQMRQELENKGMCRRKTSSAEEAATPAPFPAAPNPAASPPAAQAGILQFTLTTEAPSPMERGSPANSILPERSSFPVLHRGGDLTRLSLPLAVQIGANRAPATASPGQPPGP